MTTKHSVDAMCRAGGTTRRGVRWWEEQGLLGEVERSDGGMRRYTDHQIDLARIIAAAQFGRFELETIKGMLASYSVDRSVHDAIVTRLSDQVRAASRLASELPKPPELGEPTEFDL